MSKNKVKYDFSKIIVAPYKGSDKMLIEKGSGVFDYEAWTDGGCETASDTYGIGAAAYVIFKGGKEIKRRSRGCRSTTNNRMELMAAISAVLSVEDNASILIHTDSQYIIYMLTKNEYKDDAMNLDILNKWLTWRGNRKIAFEWVKGHNGDPYNELCDCLCVQRIRELTKK